ncbi:MAG: tRNA uridine-5-carboxymethylaminomethyl(34) synthesis GTPase MnmE [Deltaproteobacteria bacterium]|nr:MAG: tRNA uridine-5-carboxymethylaminomethyl(34) synthesis GTPase MnmE [Deltaproteobacteria bacterium]
MLSFDTIVAPVTPPGEGGVGIVRLSGPQAVDFLGVAFRGKRPTREMESHRLYHGYLLNRDKERVDEVLAVIMRAPQSYTCEDVVEVHCHGGTQVLRGVLDIFLEAGARMAAPGEFTQRAFLNGRLDLAQAEAVIEVIRARSECAGRIALDQLDGHLSREINRFSDQIKKALVLLESHIDFPDDEVGSLDLPGLLAPVQEASLQMNTLANSFDVGRALREGISVLILGRPNVGKSSLMNALLGESRAIVTAFSGTTRDTLEEQLVLAGFPVRLVDAAGVCDTNDPVEQEGVRRAREKALVADLVLMVVDGSCSLTDEDFLALELCKPDKTLVVVNKSDQAQNCQLEQLAGFPYRVAVSAKYCLGLDGLSEAIVERMNCDNISVGSESVVVSERRHRDALLQAVAALKGFLASVDEAAPLECLALDLREALSALGQITGETTPDDILDQIFSQFCVGK